MESHNYALVARAALLKVDRSPYPPSAEGLSRRTPAAIVGRIAMLGLSDDEATVRFGPRRDLIGPRQTRNRPRARSLAGAAPDSRAGARRLRTRPATLSCRCPAAFDEGNSTAVEHRAQHRQFRLPGHQHTHTPEPAIPRARAANASQASCQSNPAGRRTRSARKPAVDHARSQRATWRCPADRCKTRPSVTLIKDVRMLHTVGARLARSPTNFVEAGP
jgi:hypothetical protein